MKVMLDLSKLRDEGNITQAEYDKLMQFYLKPTHLPSISL